MLGIKSILLEIIRNANTKSKKILIGNTISLYFVNDFLQKKLPTHPEQKNFLYYFEVFVLDFFVFLLVCFCLYLFARYYFSEQQKAEKRRVETELDQQEEKLFRKNILNKKKFFKAEGRHVFFIVFLYTILEVFLFFGASQGKSPQIAMFLMAFSFPFILYLWIKSSNFSVKYRDDPIYLSKFSLIFLAFSLVTTPFFVISGEFWSVTWFFLYVFSLSILREFSRIEV